MRHWCTDFATIADFPYHRKNLLWLSLKYLLTQSSSFIFGLSLISKFHYTKFQITFLIRAPVGKRPVVWINLSAEAFGSPSAPIPPSSPRNSSMSSSCEVQCLDKLYRSFLKLSIIFRRNKYSIINRSERMMESTFSATSVHSELWSKWRKSSQISDLRSGGFSRSLNVENKQTLRNYSFLLHSMPLLSDTF